MPSRLDLGETNPSQRQSRRKLLCTHLSLSSRTTPVLLVFCLALAGTSFSCPSCFQAAGGTVTAEPSSVPPGATATPVVDTPSPATGTLAPEETLAPAAEVRGVVCTAWCDAESMPVSGRVALERRGRRPPELGSLSVVLEIPRRLVFCRYAAEHRVIQ